MAYEGDHKLLLQRYNGLANAEYAEIRTTDQFLATAFSALVLALVVSD